MSAFSDVVCTNMLDVVPKQVQFWLVDGICEDFVSWMLENVDQSGLELCFLQDQRENRTRAGLELKLQQFKEGLKLLRHGPPTA